MSLNVTDIQAVGGPSVDFLGSFLWQFLTFITAIVAVIGFLIYVFYISPPIARQMIKAKWSKGVPAFIENEVGVVEFVMTDKQLPEGVKHIKGKGWYANAVRDVTEVEYEDNLRKTEAKEETAEVSDTVASESMSDKKAGPGRPVGSKSKATLEKEARELLKEAKQNDELLEMITHTPMLNGLGKQVFFGSTTSVALTGLKTIAHADLRKTRLLAPRMYSKTQLAALAAGSREEGKRMMGKETTKILVLCIGAAILLGSLGLVVYLILNGGSKTVQVAAPEAEMIAGSLLKFLT